MASYEKSCGGVIFRENDGTTEYLVIFNRKGNAPGHWGFAKGHMEDGETEKQTAEREISEETGLAVEFVGKFKAHSRYSPKVGVIKDVIYFLARSNDGEVKIQQSEVADYAWLDFESAYKKLSNAGDKSILYRADEYVKKAVL